MEEQAKSFGCEFIMAEVTGLISAAKRRLSTPVSMSSRARQ